MRKFTNKIITFCIPALLFFISTFIFYHISKLKVDSKLKELSEYRILLMGDSQIQRLDGELISNRTKNLASSAEHYYFTYQKLLTLVEKKNHKIDKLILGVSIHNFAPVYNRLFNIDFSEGKDSLIRYIYFIRPFDDSNFITNFDGLFKSVFSGIYSTPDWGGFKVSTNSNPNKEIINTTFNMHFSIKQNEDKFSYSQRTYLYKIDSLCTFNNIDLILLSTPYHSRYKEKIDTEYDKFFSESLRKLNHRTHLNFMADKINPNFMSDANHLNKLGAKKYSEIIAKEIKAQTHNNVYNKY
jgi:hypothetical protein